MNSLKRLLPFAVIAAMALLLVWLPDIVPERYTDLATYFSIERGRQGIVGYSIAAVKEGRPWFAGAYGTDSAGIPLDTFTPLAIGELSSAVTGLLVLGSEYEGKLDLDKPLTFYLPDLSLLPASSNAAHPAATPTLRNFLTHTSGFNDGDIDDRHPGAVNLVSAVRNLANVKPRYAPGVNFDYIETGYQALGLVLERVMGTSFAKLASKRVFVPLGMKQSGAEGGEAAKRIPSGATVFFGTAIPVDQVLPAFRAPSAGMIATAPDFARAMAALVNPGFGDLVIPPPRALSALPVALSPVGGWTYGWKVSESRHGPELTLKASIEGYSAIATMWPERKSGIVIISPENSLLLSWIALPALVEGARGILVDGSSEPPLPLGRFNLLFLCMAAVHIIILAAQTGNALAWARGVRGRSDASGRPGTIKWARIGEFSGIGLRIGLVIALPVVLSIALGRRAGWDYLFGIEPGICGWVIVAIGLGILRSVARLSWLRGPSSQARKMRLLLRKQ